jgi:histidinol-phosphate aminotransferase
VSGPVSLARADLRQFVPYESAVPRADMTRLHANESPWRHDWDDTDRGLNRYPEPRNEKVAGRLAELYGVGTDEVLVTRGSDDAIDVLVRAFCEAGRDSVVVCPPTFGMYAVAARLQGATVREIPLLADREFRPDLSATVAAGETAKIVFLCSPNNPTGNIVSAEDVSLLCDRLANRALVVVDEAYAEFAAGPSAVTLRARHDNLVILRTLSKAYALAGARIGALIGDAEMVRLLRGVLPPYPVPTLSLEAAERLLVPDALDRARAEVASTVARREWLATALSGLKEIQRIWPSEGNFLLVRFRDADSALTACRAGGILLRDFSRAPGLVGCVRITVGDEDQNRALVDILRSLC